MDTKKRKGMNLGAMIGLLMAGAGAILLLQNLDVVDMNLRLRDFWPMIFILIGFSQLFSARHKDGYFWGITFTGVGTLFLLNNFNVIDFRFHDLWPIVIIMIGVAIIKNSLFPSRKHHKYCGDKQGRWSGCFQGRSERVSNDHLDVSAIFGGGDYVLSNKNFKGGSINAVCGGCEIDLSSADIEDEKAVLDISVVMGGVDIRIPYHWEVVLNGTPVLGTMENKTSPQGDSLKQLIINGSVVMGGIELKN
jgi:predicted membrane protein